MPESSDCLDLEDDEEDPEDPDDDDDAGVSPSIVRGASVALSKVLG